MMAISQAAAYAFAGSMTILMIVLGITWIGNKHAGYHWGDDD